VPEAAWNHEEPARCARCGARLRADVFPAHFVSLEPGAAPESIVVEGDAGCFYHPSKRAVLVCDACGRFLCSLCEVELGGRRLCAGCVEGQRQRGGLDVLETERTLYDRIALSLAVYPLLIFYFTLVTAPAAIYVALRYWRAPGSLVGGTKARFVAAIVISLAQITGWVALGILLYRTRAQIFGPGRPR